MTSNGTGILGRTIHFLAEPELVLHENPTKEDHEAVEIIKDILQMYGTPDELKVLYWGKDRVEWVLPKSLPAVKTSGCILHGINDIRRAAKIERHDWESAIEYRKHVAA